VVVELFETEKSYVEAMKTLVTVSCLDIELQSNFADDIDALFSISRLANCINRHRQIDANKSKIGAKATELYAFKFCGGGSAVSLPPPLVFCPLSQQIIFN
jgi:hypothetical protein